MSNLHENGQDHVPRLAVIGGGIAGITAAETALRAGYQVDLFEWSRVLGGKAASLYEPGSGQWIDNGQHIALGCCTELLALHERLGLTEFFDVKDSIPFAQKDGKRWVMAASPYLPNRWQLAPAFLKIPFLSFKDRLSTGLLVRKLGKKNKATSDDSALLNDQSFASWLKAEHASAESIEKFWAPLIFSALSETVENVSLEAVKKTIQDGFLSGKDAMAMHIPTASLRTIYHDKVSQKLEESGAKLHFLSKVRRLHWRFPEGQSEDHDSPVPEVESIELKDGTKLSFDRYILAVPAFQAWKILAESDLDSYAESLGLDKFEPGAITSVHLWFDRPLFQDSFTHTALLGGPGQFLFQPPRRLPSDCSSKIRGRYYTVVISASHRILSEEELTSQGSRKLVDRVLEQLRSTFSESFKRSPKGDIAEPQLLHWRVTSFFDAVFSPTPAIYLDRPSQETPFSNLALAGDWTFTQWPSTLEGAVRSALFALNFLE